MTHVIYPSVRVDDMTEFMQIPEDERIRDGEEVRPVGKIATWNVNSPRFRLPSLLDWLEDLMAYTGALLAGHPCVVIYGDFNTAPEDCDVDDPDAWRGKVLCSKPEGRAFKALTEAGFHVPLRKSGQPKNTISWWDYRTAAFFRCLFLDTLVGVRGFR